MKKYYLLLLFFPFTLVLHADWKWINPMNAGFPVIQNQGWAAEIGDTYTRLPQRAKGVVREPVWNLSRQSAGLAIHFYSNTPEIRVRYGVHGAHQMPHMPATGVSGIDLYAIDSDGQQRHLAGDFSFKDTITYHFKHIPPSPYHSYGYEFRLYLPLYNSVEWLEIGIPEEASFSFIPLSGEKPILVYGTSIVQGACASRPGMAWTTIMQRSLDYPVINLGFSGNGWMEPEMVDFLCETEAQLYVLDCLPNLVRFDEEEITERILHCVRTLRQYQTAPILLVEHSGYSNEYMDTQKKADTGKSNRASLKAFERLESEGIPALFYMQDTQSLPIDSWVDYVHYNDGGMQSKAAVVMFKIREILGLYELPSYPTHRPVTQRREPHNYEWRTRHESILELNRTDPPRAVILGNSITHFWGGEPAGPVCNGPESWKKYMAPRGYRNLGYGWDRIENVLWRVYHGELDGYEAEEVILMIGTNNIGLNDATEIEYGIKRLALDILVRQPQAIFKVIGILPRRGHEEEIKRINQKMHFFMREQGITFIDPGRELLLENGKIDESLFLDGLHPNEKGYMLIAPLITKSPSNLP
ncbi:MAG: SGNH/GDSL hydrolase family protein [Tannerellaceae bacterium]|nr:SGNH/GDSL hydrolase family protein [Tannerellaceae bacterium]